ncbi:phage tail tape measure protein, partial [Escherichia coli]|uniref:phage tail tape measure protein n=2 Tax=Escherichia coli TaxID=562 RepID=UPI001FCD0940
SLSHLFCVEVRISPLIRWPNLLCHYTEAILPLRRGADGKLGVVADIGGSGMAMFAPQYNIEINNDGTNGQIGPAALKVVYDLGKKAAADFMQQQARDGGRLSGAYR